MSSQLAQVVPGVAALLAVLGLGAFSYQQSNRIAELEAQVADLEGDVDDLGVRRGRGSKGPMPDGAPAVGPRGPRAEPGPRGAGGPPVVRRPMGGDEREEISTLADMDPDVEQALREVVRSERESEREAEREARIDRISTRIDERVEELTDSLGLSDTQSTEIAAMWKTELETMMSVRDEVRAGELEWSEARTQIESMRKENDAKAKEMLDDGQYEGYATARQEMGPGRGRGGRGGPPPGGPPPE